MHFQKYMKTPRDESRQIKTTRLKTKGPHLVRREQSLPTRLLFWVNWSQRTYSDNKHSTRERKRIHILNHKRDEKKLEIAKCSLCERKVLKSETSGYDFDHLDDHEKDRNVSIMISKGFSWENVILPEIKKCRLLCANCHVVETINQRQLRKKQFIKKKTYSV